MGIGDEDMPPTDTPPTSGHERSQPSWQQWLQCTNNPSRASSNQLGCGIGSSMLRCLAEAGAGPAPAPRSRSRSVASVGGRREGRRGLPWRARHLIARVQDHPAAIVGVVASALATWVYWPILVAPGTVMPHDLDAPLFIWSFEHAPRQVFGGHNPFTIEAIFATTGGANLAYNATAPGLGLLMFPVTAWLGPVASFNALTAVTPALNALAAYRLLRIVSGHRGASSALGALLIGFSSLVLMENGARVQIAFQAVGLLLLAGLWMAGAGWFAGRALSARAMVRGGALAGAQLWIGSELLAIVALMAATTVLVAVGMRRRAGVARTARLRRRDIGAVAAGGASLLLVGAPFVVALVLGDERFTGSYHGAARDYLALGLANLVTPTEVIAISDPPLAADRGLLGGLPFVHVGYISLAGVVLVAVAIAGWRHREPVLRGALFVSGILGVLALGPTIRWNGIGGGVPGPWRLVETAPVLRELVFARLMFGVVIGLGVVVTFMARGSRRRPLDRVGVVACACPPILLFPARMPFTRAVQPSTEVVLERLCAGALVVTVPESAEPAGMAWQARSGFAFDLYRGFAFRESSPPRGDHLVIDELAITGGATRSSERAAVAELRELGIDCVVSSRRQATVANTAAVLGRPAVDGEVAVWLEARWPGDRTESG